MNNGSKDSPDNLIEKYPFNSMIRMEKSSDVAKDIVLLDYKKYEVPSDYNVDVIDIHAYDENKVYVALLKHGFGNYTQFETISIGYVDLETNEYVKIKDINNQSRIADFKMMKGKLIYTLVPKTPEVLKSDFLVYFVIEEDAGKKTIIDQGQVVYAMDTPFLTIYNNKIYYPKTSVDYHKEINRQEGDFDLDYKFELIEYNPQTTERKLLDSSRGVYSDNHGGYLPEVYIFDSIFKIRENDIYLKWSNENKTKISTVDSTDYHSIEMDFLSIKVGLLKDKYLLVNSNQNMNQMEIVTLDKESLTVMKNNNFSSGKVKDFGRFFSNDKFAIFHLNDDDASIRYCEDLDGDFTDVYIKKVNGL